jgi:hypothetical protein
LLVREDGKSLVEIFSYRNNYEVQSVEDQPAFLVRPLSRFNK